MTHILTHLKRNRALTIALIILLLAIGYATDGITEIGHHACFILAGIGIGIVIRTRH